MLGQPLSVNAEEAGALGVELLWAPNSETRIWGHGVVDVFGGGGSGGETLALGDGFAPWLDGDEFHPDHDGLGLGVVEEVLDDAVFRLGVVGVMH